MHCCHFEFVYTIVTLQHSLIYLNEAAVKLQDKTKILHLEFP